MRLDPRMPESLLTFVGARESLTVFTLSAEAEIPSADSTNPKYCTRGCTNTHFPVNECVSAPTWKI